jgi:Ni/Co efflux regulator RcnB
MRLLIATIALGLCAAPASAEKPEWAGKGKGKGHDRDDDRGRHFKDEHRRDVRDYYDDEFRRGQCPPGLAKKHNGCLPPGQAKKWRVGRPIPSGVVVYDVPPALVVRLGVPPAGHKYVRVASDILLIAVGTSIVVDAINDLGRR